MQDRVGQQLGNYRLLRLLGRGGFAEVYLGEHLYLKSHAALKVLHTQLADEDAYQFVREAQLLASLLNPHIVRILDFTVQEGIPFLVMEYAPGGTLRTRHPRQTRLQLDTIVVYVSQVAEALQYAHDLRLIHRDVKPENMLLGSRADVLLSDFGLVMLAPHTLPASTQLIAPLASTAPYLAPEQIQGKAGPASDQYALGVVVYEWITGTPPFRGLPIEIAMQHLSVPPPSLREQVKELSPAIEEVVLRALAKAPELRFASVNDFASALVRASHDAVSLQSIPRSSLGTGGDRKRSATPPLSIHLLGEFQLVSSGTPITTVDWPRLQSLLAYLVLHTTAPQSRTHLAFLLWPDSTEAQAHTNLRHLLHRLRRALPTPNNFLRAEKQTLQWQPDAPWTLDVADFERAVARAEQAEKQAEVQLVLEQAVELYRGDLLPGCYDEWILSERERLRHLFLDVLERLTLLLEQKRDYQAAIRAAQRLLRHDPLHEATYRHLMRLYALTGDRAAALRTYHTCATVLERELATEPGPATREAYEQLVRIGSSPVRLATPMPTLAAVAPLVGRPQEWAQMQEVWQASVAGRPHMVLLAGEAGIGKTRLAEELLDWVGRQGMTTAVARCYPAEGELVYAPVATWLRTEALRMTLTGLADVWLTEVARFVPELLREKSGLPPPGPLTEPWQRQRLFEALARAVLAARQPLLLLLDDLQWCDRETLEWLHFLLRFDPQARLLLLATARSEEIGDIHPLQSLLATVRPSGQVTELLLEALNAPDTASLAAHITGHDVTSDMVADLYRETEGNPLFVVETIRMTTGGTKGMEDPSPGASITALSSQLPPTVQAVIAARLEQLSPLARKMVNLAATIGRAFTFQVLAHASHDDEDTLVGCLDELWQRRIVREQSTGSLDAYDFSHDKLREVAYATMSAARRRLLHRRVAEALEAVYANRLDEVSGLVAAHYEQAGDVERAITSYQRAAEVARQVYANAEAIRSYQRVLGLLKGAWSPRTPQELWREVTSHVQDSLGDVFTLTGQLEEARTAYQEALAQVPMHDYIRQAHLHRKRAQTWKTQRRFDEGLQAYSTAEAVLEGEAVERTQEWWQEWIEIQHERIEIHYLQAQLYKLTELVEQTRPVVERYGTPVQRADFFLDLARISIRRDRYVASEQTVEYARSLLAAYLELEDKTGIAWARFILGYVYLWHGDLDLAEEHIQAAQVMGEQIGEMRLQSRCLIYLTVLFRKRGQVEEARRLGSQALAIATAMQLPDYIAMAKANLAWVTRREGNLSEAQANALAALELWRPLPVVNAFHWMALWPLIGVALTQDRLTEAIDYARQLLDQEQQPPPEALNTLVEALVRAWDSGAFEIARRHLQPATALAQEMGYL